MKRSGLELNYEPKKMTRLTAPEGKEWKWGHYFSQLPGDVRDSIEMDDVALFSVTIDKDADVITGELSNYLPNYARICDATSCVGGNVMSFAKYFTDVTAVEMDTGRYEMLKSNINKMKQSDRVHCVNYDFVTYMKNMPVFDFIFFDPPWGGENYQEMGKIDMFLSNISIGDVIASLRDKVHYVGLKSPQNFDMANFEKRIDAKVVYRHSFDISKKKQTFWEFTLFEFISDTHGAILHMLSPSLSPAIAKQLRINALTSIQAPSYMEATAITRHIHDKMSKTADMLIEYHACIGIQSINFVEEQLVPDLFLLSSLSHVLDPNVSICNTAHVVKTHFMQSTTQIIFSPVPSEIRSALRCYHDVVIYIDLYVMLNYDQLLNGGAYEIRSSDNRMTVEMALQRIVEDSAWECVKRMFVIRCPGWWEERLVSAMSSWHVDVVRIKQDVNMSSLCSAHVTSLLFISPLFPLETSNQQLITFWKPVPTTSIRRTVDADFAATLQDRPAVLASLRTDLDTSTNDMASFVNAHEKYIMSFGRQGAVTPGDWSRVEAIQADRSVVRVYANKLKYVDTVIPYHYAPKSILCIGSVDAHLGHEMTKRFGIDRPVHVTVLGEEDRREGEHRNDYVFMKFPPRDNNSLYEYRNIIEKWIQGVMNQTGYVDLIVTICPHNIPYFGTIIDCVTEKMAVDGVLVLYDHHVTSEYDRTLLNIIHDFHRQVTCPFTLSIMDRQELKNCEELPIDDRCGYVTREMWEQRLTSYGFSRIDNELNRTLWVMSDPSNVLKSFWGSFTFVGKFK